MLHQKRFCHLIPGLEFVQFHDDLGIGMDPLKIKPVLAWSVLACLINKPIQGLKFCQLLIPLLPVSGLALLGSGFAQQEVLWAQGRAGRAECPPPWAAGNCGLRVADLSWWAGTHLLNAALLGFCFFFLAAFLRWAVTMKFLL